MITYSFKKIPLMLFLAGLLTLTSCLESEENFVDFTKVEPTAELPLAGFNPGGKEGAKIQAQSYLATETNATLPVAVNIASPKPLDRPVTATLKIENQAFLDAYNAKTPATTFTLLPAASYSASNLSVTIPAGERIGYVNIDVKPGTITDFTKTYVLPITLVDAEGVKISNYNTIYYIVGARNQWDGLYTIETGSEIFRNSATGPDPTLSGSTAGKPARSLITRSGNEVGITPIWANGSGIAGIDDTYLTINPDNTVTVKSSTNPVLKNTPGKPNFYDPATKTFTLNFDWGVAPSTRVTTMILKYQRARP